MCAIFYRKLTCFCLYLELEASTNTHMHMKYERLLVSHNVEILLKTVFMQIQFYDLRLLLEFRFEKSGEVHTFEALKPQRV